MTIFSDENAPTRAPSGPEIPTGVRSVILDWFQSGAGITPTAVFDELALQHGYGSAVDVGHDVDERWGEEAGRAFIGLVAEATRGLVSTSPTTHKVQARPILEFAPAPLFLDALEGALRLYARFRAAVAARQMADLYEPWGESLQIVNRLFERRGIYYRVNEDGRAEWFGDAAVREIVISPALEALGDHRLAGANSEFQQALGHLRAGTPKELEDAIDEAAKSVESAMKVLLDEHHQPRPGKETAWPLFGAILEAGVVEPEADNAVLGAARVRNNLAAHGSGSAPREVPADLAQLAVHSAASALVYLAGRLP